MANEKDWISLKEFMKINKIGYEVAMQMIADKKIDVVKTPGGRYKIRAGGETVSKEMYEREKEKRIQAETKLNLLKQILVERN